MRRVSTGVLSALFLIFVVAGCVRSPDSTVESQQLTEEQKEAKDFIRDGVEEPTGKGDARLMFDIRAVGDIMMGTDFPSESYLPPSDGEKMFQQVDQFLKGSSFGITFGNLEGPLCDGGETHKCDGSGACYAFRTPTAYGQYLMEAGFDVFSIANNHALDFGQHCRDETMTVLETLGLKYSGPQGTVATMRRMGMKIGLIAFHTAKHSHYLNNHDKARQLVSEVHANHDLVLVSFHGGAEGEDAMHVPEGPEMFYGTNRGDLQVFSRAVIDAGADLVLGHGPHVPRGMEVYKDRLIAYSLGNFATYGRFSLDGPQGVGYVFNAVLQSDGTFYAGKIDPVELVRGGIPRPDEDARAIEYVANLTRQDFPETGVTVSDDGYVFPPTMEFDSPVYAEDQ